jgi:phospholipase C
VNTIQATSKPHGGGFQLPPQTAPTIGDRLSGKNVDWAWYSGGWDNAAGNTTGPGWTNGTGGTCTDPGHLPSAVFPNCADKLFQFHHQPFNYFATYAEGGAGRGHLRDEVEFIDAAKHGALKPVSFVKPIGEENEHPGYASEHSGNSHLVDLLKAIEGGPQAADTMVIVTYDEFGGQWDHVSPPKVDRWGPGTRIPTLIISPRLAKPFAVDHVGYDTTSILSTVEHRWNLESLSDRDKNATDLSGVLATSGGGEGGGGGLPITGAPVAAIIAIGAGLVGLGAIVLLASRRRRRSV